MQKKKQTKPIKQILLFMAIVIIILLIIFAEDIIKLTPKNKLDLAQNPENELINNEPNPPQLSAGMIPVKWDGTNWVITTKTDKDWYDYKKGIPAYVMLNDGTYQSELVRNMEENGQKLAEKNVNIQIQPDELGTIFMWVPRYQINEENEIKYVKDVNYADEGYEIPEVFAYMQAETLPDFLLTGIWLEKDVDNAYASKINQMNQEESIYGFIKNTFAMQTNQTTQNEIQNYINKLSTDISTDDQWSPLQSQEDTNTSNNTDITQNVGADASVRPQITNITNPNRIILKIINQKNQDPIKAKATLNENTMEVTINVTYTKCGILKIEDAKGTTLSENSKTAVDTNITSNGTYYYTITDKLGNTKRINVKVDVTTTLTYNTNGGTTVANTTAGYGDAIKMPIPERTYTISYVTNNNQTLENTTVSYTFDGWYTEETGGEKREYTTMPLHSETLYAHWTETSIELPTLTPESVTYKFEGWYSNSGLTTSVGAGGATYTPTSNITLYGKWKTQVDYYGALVTNYSAGGVSEWQVFHIDDKNIYLIAKDYITRSQIPTSRNGNSLNAGSSSCPNAAYFSNILNDYTGSAWILNDANTKPEARKWLSWVDTNQNSKNSNIKAVAYMMDTNKWGKFVDTNYADYAIGGPTLELFCASYKVTHPSKWIECNSTNTNGYQVRWSNGSYAYYVIGLPTNNNFEGIYIKSDSSKANGMWLASPSAYSTKHLMYADYSGGVGYSDYYYANLGFRPLVCLTSGVQLVDNGDGTCRIQKD